MSSAESSSNVAADSGALGDLPQLRQGRGVVRLRENGADDRGDRLARAVRHRHSVSIRSPSLETAQRRGIRGPGWVDA